MDLGYELVEGGMIPRTDTPESPAGPIYPGLSLSDKPANDFMDEHPDLKLGDEITVTMKLRVNELSERNQRWSSGSTVGFDCLSMELVKGAPEGEPEEEEDKDRSPSRERLRSRRSTFV